jgi:uncharacterized delta-60 repeat protein
MLGVWLRDRVRRRSKRSFPGRDRGQRLGYQPTLESLEDRTLLAAGALDPTFGTGGLVKTNFLYNVADSATTGFNSLAVQADGKIVVADVANGPTPGFTVGRFNANGSADGTFGAGGFAHVQFSPTSTDQATAVAVEADGKIVVAGTTTDSSGNRNFGVTRFNPNGTLDTTFGFNQNGLVVIDFTGPTTPTHVDAVLSSMIVEADGRIVLGGSATFNKGANGPSGVPVVDFAVARLNNDGTQDADFDADGRVVFNVGATLSNGQFVSTDDIADINVQTDGKIVAVGWTNIRNDGKAIDLADNFGIARFNADGTLDKTFSGGVVSYDLSLSPFGATASSPYKDRAYSVAIQLDGKILVSGTSQWQVAGPGGNPPADLTQDNFATIRLNANGAFDNTFTADGTAITDFAPDFSIGSEDQANDVTVQADGKILVTGFTTTAAATSGPVSTPNINNKNFAMARYNTDGTLDQTFGFHGKVITDVGAGGSDYGNQAAVLINGQLLVAGGVGDNPNATLAFGRYTGFQPGTIQFSASNYNVNENGGTVSILVTRIGDPNGTAVVGFATTSGSAVAGTDYTPVTGTLTFGPGVTSQSFTVAVRDDGVFQSANKVFNVTLTSISGGPTFGTPTTATVTLLETDQPGGNINPGPGPGPTPGPTPSTPNQKFVNQVFLDLLGRPADASALTSFGNYLDAGGSRTNVVEIVDSSAEYRGDVVRALYQTYLHRAPDPSGLNAAVNFLSQGGTDEQLAAGLIGSPEYYQVRGGGTNDGFLNALYADALGRAPDANGRAAFDQALASGTSTTQVGFSILTSVEYDTDLVGGYYVRFLRRPADQAGLNNYVNLLQHGSQSSQPIFVGDPSGGSHPVRDEDVIAFLMGSQEYFNFAISH